MCLLPACHIVFVPNGSTVMTSFPLSFFFFFFYIISSINGDCLEGTETLFVIVIWL